MRLFFILLLIFSISDAKAPKKNKKHSEKKISKSKSSGANLPNLFQLCESDNYKALLKIPNLKSRLNTANREGYTPLAYCIERGSQKSAEVLIKHETNFNWKGPNRYNLALLSSRNGMLSILKTVLKKKPNLLKSKDRFNNSLLDHAISRKRVLIIEYFLQSYPSWIASEKLKNLTLFNLAESGSPEIIKLLFPEKPKISENKESQFLQKCAESKPELLDTFLEIGFRLEAKDEEGDTVLHKIVENGDSDLLISLIEKKPNLKKNNNDESLLHLAVKYNREEIVEILLKNGLKPEEVDKEGNTSLHLSVENDSPGIIYKLIKSGMDINAKNGRGDTPLSIARQSENETAIYLLLLAGAKEE
ncbi:MAG: ankyrin repeat domain-containing protein [Leptospiraceae bacterium]|nr:ankyrin repeat domain-containing protein [Leptospiraceae bacterium]MCP5512261.1 ankyrin repeat domain-containing protein [Leptospiraceae bacterium]